MKTLILGILGFIGVVFLSIGLGIYYAADTLPIPSKSVIESNMLMKAWEVHMNMTASAMKSVIGVGPHATPEFARAQELIDKSRKEYDKAVDEYQNAQQKYNQDMNERNKKHEQYKISSVVMLIIGGSILLPTMYMILKKILQARRRSRDAENSDSDGSETVDS